MKIILSISFILLATVAFAQGAKKDTVYIYNQPIDTTGMSEYGMRFYGDVQTTRYTPTNTDFKESAWLLGTKKKHKKKNNRTP